MADGLRVVTETDFDEVVLRSPVPVLIDFFTEWCAPCKALAPTLVDLSEEYGETARIVSVDAEKSPELASRYDVTGYPTMVLIKEGAEVSRPRVRTRTPLREVLDAALGVTRVTQLTSTLPPESADVAPELEALVAQLATLDAADWKQVEARLLELTQQPSSVTDECKEVDEGALSDATTRLLNDVEELALQRVADKERAPLIASAASASFDRWVRRNPLGAGWTGSFRAVPAARMSAYLPAGDAPADIAAAASTYLEKLGGLTDDEWVQIRAVNRDLWPFVEHKDHGTNAFLCAVILIQAVQSASLLPASALDAAWEPFAGLLDRAEVEAA